MRHIEAFNQAWLYIAEPVGLETPDSAFESVTLPHTNKRLPYHNFSDSEYQFISTYRKRFTVPQSPNGRRIFLDFDGVLTACTVTLNGHTFPEHRGGFTPFSFDITEYLNLDSENVLSVSVDSRERKDIPPFGYTVDYMVFGGIYRDVNLRYVAPIYLENVHVRAHDVLTTAPKVEFVATVQNTTDTEQFVAITANLTFWKDEFASAIIPPKSSGTLTAWTNLGDMPADKRTLWSLESPTLHTFSISLYEGNSMGGADEKRYDTVSIRTGLRDARFESDGFFLNGEKIKLRGLNRHQNYPYIGASAPERLQRKDADILKYDLGCNVVRTSHYPQSPHFLARCDEIGLLVFEEIPGWQHIGDDDWQALTLHNVRSMITRDWNHPSIILWGVRINESWDNTALYTKTNELARQLDPTRQTGGVRFFMGSEFLEDVYTLNDFSNGILEPEHTPHLVTEFNGHMFPTKTWDNEERRTEHALRHAKVQSRAFSMGGVSGAIGWCAFDYNTHVEFGAGDRICYHGVMDIFRLPKFASYFYESQQSPTQKVVLRACTNWSLGDVKEGLIEPITVFSNCDTIEAYVGGEKKGTFTPDTTQYTLPHPPFTLKDLGAILAHPYGDLRLVGYINGQPVAEQSIASEKLPHALVLEPDDSTLQADGADMTRIVFRITDKYGNTLPYSLTAVTFTLEGDAELIGENPFALVGGQGAVYLKAAHTANTVTLIAQANRLPEARVTLTIEAI